MTSSPSKRTTLTTKSAPTTEDSGFRRRWKGLTSSSPVKRRDTDKKTEDGSSCVTKTDSRNRYIVFKGRDGHNNSTFTAAKYLINNIEDDSSNEENSGGRRRRRWLRHSANTSVTHQSNDNSHNNDGRNDKKDFAKEAMRENQQGGGTPCRRI